VGGVCGIWTWGGCAGDGGPPRPTVDVAAKGCDVAHVATQCSVAALRVWAEEIDPSASTKRTMRAGFIRTSVPRSLSKNRQVEGIGHSLIAGVIGMNVIARIEFRTNPDGALRIAHYSIEIHDSIESLARTNPLID